MGAPHGRGASREPGLRVRADSQPMLRSERQRPAQFQAHATAKQGSEQKVSKQEAENKKHEDTAAKSRVAARLEADRLKIPHLPESRARSLLPLVAHPKTPDVSREHRSPTVSSKCPLAPCKSRAREIHPQVQTLEGAVRYVRE
jgi:hypothetical protein